MYRPWFQPIERRKQVVIGPFSGSRDHGIIPSARHRLRPREQDSMDEAVLLAFIGSEIREDIGRNATDNGHERTRYPNRLRVLYPVHDDRCATPRAQIKL